MQKPIFKEGYYYGALLYAFLIPFHQKIATLAIILWAFLSVLNFDKEEVKNNRSLWLLPLFYATYAIGLVTSGTVSFGFLETKLSFLIFPLIFYLQKYSDFQRKNMFVALVYGVIFSAVLCFIVATCRSITIKQGVWVFAPNVLEGKGAIESILYGGNYFFGSFFSIFHQTVYFALYVTVAMAIVIFREDLFPRKIRLFLGFFFFLLLFFISNKAAVIAACAILFLRICTLKISTQRKWITLLVATMCIGVFVWLNPRTSDSIRKITNEGLTIDKNGRYGFKTRLLTWSAATALLKEESFIGYGVGETQEKLNEKYKQKEYIYPLKESYNAHNLWLQTWLENGIIGLLVLSLLFFTLFRAGVKDTYFGGFILSLVMVLFINSLFESIFNRFSGVSFFAFITCFVLTNSKSTN